ncbi:MAG TPA: hydrogenase expression/formation protein [Rhodocyclaceae bacterium]|jgi:hydrogenase-1 operon protein HyaF|nr:hydrogenase expression/formation protein [Rhodocyclaceae bacterium]HNM82466.1 hydrogenase expression/formation protein [Rhodocyclaceae bacterium]
MNPAALRPFPISVVAMGPGSQGEEAPDYLPLPQMDTFHAPRLPENASPEQIAAAAEMLGAYRERMDMVGFAGGALFDLLPLRASVREVITQSLGFGEVSAFTTAPQHWRVQESAFAGLWRVLRVADDGTLLVDRLECGPIPAVLGEMMLASAADSLDPPAYPAGVMNAEALVEEIRRQAAGWQPGSSPHIVNLTLLPVSDADLDTLYGWLGHREVSILSRGYGNCRITSTRLKNVWWVQYFNSMDALILNSIEIAAMPEVALASPEDFADTLERLADYLDMMAEPA